MIIKVAYNTDCEVFADKLLTRLKREYPDIEVLAYNEDFYKEKKNAIKFKYSCGTSMTPFVAIYKDNKVCKAFYSEVGDCNTFSIFNYLENV